MTYNWMFYQCPVCGVDDACCGECGNCEICDIDLHKDDCVMLVQAEPDLEMDIRDRG